MSTLRSLSVLVLLPVTIAACAIDTEPPVTREDVAAAGKGDESRDVCVEQGWYGDRICDQVCRSPDPDCERAVVLKAQHNNGAYIVDRGSAVLVQLYDRDYAGGQDWRVTQTDRTFGYPVEVVRADDLVQFRWNTEGLFDQTGRHDVELNYGTSWETFAFTVDVR
jgi:hypothetical protein